MKKTLKIRQGGQARLQRLQRSNSGQAIIIVILVLIVTAVIVLAVASRSITDVRISKTSDESAQAFSAAEAGVEEAVQRIRSSANPVTASPITVPITSNNASVTYSIAQQGGSTKAYLSSRPVASDTQTFQVYLADHANLTSGYYTANTLCLYWGNTTADIREVPAIEASVIYQDSSNQTKITKFIIDPNGRVVNATGLTPGSCGSSSRPAATILASDNNLAIDRDFQYAHQLDLSAFGQRTQLLRLRLLFNQSQPQYIGVKPQGANLPTQGYAIESTGTVGSGTTRRVQVFNSYSALPGIFDYVLYNGSSNQLRK